jgi:transposase InsO family protein
MEEKREMIFSNKQDSRISINAGCKYYQISRSSFYYKSKKQRVSEEELERMIIYIFDKSDQTYGSRRLKGSLKKIGIIVDRSRLNKIMKRLNLVAVADISHRPPSNKYVVNNAAVFNILDRKFSGRRLYEVIVSDVTYTFINGKWNYLCVMLDLCSRQILGYAVSEHRNSALVDKAFNSMEIDYSRIQIFHSDRGGEFMSKLLNSTLTNYGIQRSLSDKGCPIDNAVCESLFNTIKTEFIKRNVFVSLEEFKYYLGKYITFYNTERLHSSLGYNSPLEYSQLQLQMEDI